MKCPKCKNVTNLRGSETVGSTIRRMRVCPKCGHRFLTYEVTQEDMIEHGMMEF